MLMCVALNAATNEVLKGPNAHQFVPCRFTVG
jgi:hypothetical protein